MKTMLTISAMTDIYFSYRKRQVPFYKSRKKSSEKMIMCSVLSASFLDTTLMKAVCKARTGKEYVDRYVIS